MTIQKRLGGSWRSATGARKFIGAGWRTATRRLKYIDGDWHLAQTFTGAFSVSIFPPSQDVSGTPTFHGSVIVSSDPFVATPSGGLGPYTYAWAVIANTGATVTIQSPAMASTIAKATVPADSTATATLRVTATDALGATAQATCALSLTNAPLEF